MQKETFINFVSGPGTTTTDVWKYYIIVVYSLTYITFLHIIEMMFSNTNIAK